MLVWCLEAARGPFPPQGRDSVFVTVSWSCLTLRGLSTMLRPHQFLSQSTNSRTSAKPATERRLK